MCGRTRVSLQPEEVLAAAEMRREQWRDAEQYKPSYNVAPGFRTPVVRQCKEASAELQTMTWGLVPSWTKKDAPADHYRMFNARSESVEEKGVFNRLLKGHRCVVLLNGFYEWAKEHTGKQPYFIHLEGEPVMRMAGLFDAWKCEDGEVLYTYTILTTDSSPRLQWLHDRMPVVLRTPEDSRLWLEDRELSSKELATLAHPYNGGDLVWHRVAPSMGKLTVQGPGCSAELRQHDIASFFQRKPAGKGKAAPAAAKACDLPSAAPSGKAARQAEAAAPSPVKAEQGAERKACGAKPSAVKAEPRAASHAPSKIKAKAEPEQAQPCAASEAGDHSGAAPTGIKAEAASREAGPAAASAAGTPPGTAPPMAQAEEDRGGAAAPAPGAAPPVTKAQGEPIRPAASAAAAAVQGSLAGWGHPGGGEPGGRSAVRGRRDAGTATGGSAAAEGLDPGGEGKNAGAGEAQAAGEAASAKLPKGSRKRPAAATPNPKPLTPGSAKKARQAAAAVAGGQQSIDGFLVKNSK